MKTLRAGDLYFLQSPFHSEGHTKDAASREKRLSYLLGTVSARPAIIIRKPVWWDKYSTCTVIPAVSKVEPSIKLRLIDRYGYETSSVYNFCPHNPHTIPVSRLGKYIGSLSDEELEEILYAFKWINDPYMQNDESYQVPPIYREVSLKKIPRSWMDNKDPRSRVSIRTKWNGDGTVDVYNESDSESAAEEPLKLDAYDMPSDYAVFDNTSYQPVETPLPDSVPATEEQINVPVESAYPPSMFSTEVLDRIASRFTISDAYYLNENKKDFSVLTKDEISRLRNDLSSFEVEGIREIYQKMSMFDAYLLGTRLPVHVLADICGISNREAVALKKFCNYLRDMPDVDYQERMNGTNTETVAAEVLEVPKPQARNKFEDKKNLDKIREYLSPKRINDLPDSLAQTFLDTPSYMIRKYWKGSQYKACMVGAINHCKKVVEQQQKQAS